MSTQSNPSAPVMPSTLTVFHSALILRNVVSNDGAKVYLTVDSLVGGRSQRFELQGASNVIDSESLPMREAVDLVAEIRPFCWVDKKSQKARMSNEVVSLKVKS